MHVCFRFYFVYEPERCLLNIWRNSKILFTRAQVKCFRESLLNSSLDWRRFLVNDKFVSWLLKLRCFFNVELNEKIIDRLLLTILINCWLVKIFLHVRKIIIKKIKLISAKKIIKYLFFHPRNSIMK
jgi:hypothetical protein